MPWRTITKEQDLRIVGGAIVSFAVAYVGYRAGLALWEAAIVWVVVAVGVHLAAGNKLHEW